MKEKLTIDIILQEAIKISDPQQRVSYLDEVCGDNETLRGEVDSLLAAHFAAEDFMATLTDPVFLEVPGEKEGDQIGRYKLLQQIGEGGFGTVYLAEQTEPVKRRVALKVIKAGMDSKEIIARFEAERQALALMDHPNIAKVHDAGTTEGGRPFFVMELVKGVPISNYCRDQNLETTARLDLFTDVCAAIQHAHQKGIIHRDLKPSNIMVSPHDGKPVVKVIDFGIAKAISMELTEKTVFTQFGRMMGTPQYMSPEQAELNALDVDTRSDIYSLGVVLYELLTGTTPLDGIQLRSAAYEEMQRLIREETPPKPSTRISAVGQKGSTGQPKDRYGLKGDLDWIAMKALEKDRTRRYETANALAQDIQRHLSDEPVSAGPPSARYRMSKFARRNRRAILSSAAAVVALLVGLSVAGGLWLNENKRITQVEEGAQILLEEAGQLMDGNEGSESVLDDLAFQRASELSRRAAELLDSTGRPNAALLERSEELRQLVEAEERSRTLVASIEEALMRAYDTFDRKEESRQSREGRDLEQAFTKFGLTPLQQPHEETLAVVNHFQGSRKDVILVGLHSWAKTLTDSEPGDAARLEEIVELADQDNWRRELRAAIKAKNAEALEALAESPDMAGQPVQIVISISAAMAEQRLAGPVEKMLRKAQAENPLSFWPNFILGTALVSAIDRKEGEGILTARLGTEINIGDSADEDARRAGKIRTKFEEPLGFYRTAVATRPASVTAWAMLGGTLMTSGHRDEAIETLRKASSLEPISPALDLLMGQALFSKGEIDEAIQCLQRAGKAEDMAGFAHFQLGMILLNIRRYDEARTALLRSVDLDSQNPVEDRGSWKLEIMGEKCDFDENSVALMVASSQAIAGDYSGALKFIRNFLKEHPDDVRAHFIQGFSLLLMGEFVAAKAPLQKAEDLGFRSSIALNIYGYSRMLQGQWEEALSYFNEALTLDPPPIKEAEILTNLGACLAQLDRVAEAEELLMKAVELNPEYALAWRNLGICYQDRKKPKKAIEYLERSLALNPSDTMPYVSLASLYWTEGDYEKAIAATRNLNEAKAYHKLGGSLVEEGMAEEAIDAFKRAIVLEPNMAGAHEGLGIAYADALRLDEALASLQNSIRLAPKQGRPHEILARIHWTRREFEKSIAARMNAVELLGLANSSERDLLLGLLVSGRPAAARLVHGDCHSPACHFDAANEAEIQLLKLFGEGKRDTPEFRGTLADLLLEMATFLDSPISFPPPETAELRAIWMNQRDEVLQRLGKATVRRIYLPGTSPEQRALAEDLLKQLESGADFGELAEKFSEGHHGGKAEEVEYGDFNKALNEPIFSLKIGAYTPEVIVAPHGLTLLKVESRTPGEAKEFTDKGVAKAAGSLIASRRIERWKNSYLKRLDNPTPDLIAARVQNLVGERHLEHGEKEQAKRLFEKALATFKAGADATDPTLLRIEKNLAAFKNPPKALEIEENEENEEWNPEKEKSLKEAQDKVAELKKRARPEDEKLIRALVDLGYACATSRKPKEALEKAREAERLARKLHRGNHRTIARCLFHHGGILRELGKYEEALDLLTKTLTMEKALKVKGSSLARTHNSLGQIHGDLGDYEKAKEHLNVAYKIRVTIFGPEHKIVAESLNNLALNRLNRGDLVGAKERYLESLKIDRHPVSLSNLGDVLSKLSEFGEAKKAYHEAIELLKLQKGIPSRQNHAMALNGLALVLFREGLREDAKVKYEKALKIHQEAMGPGHPGEAAIRINLGLLLSGEEAVKMQEEALALTRARFGPGRDHDSAVLCLNNLALAQMSVGRFQDAEKNVKEALAMARRIHADGNPHEVVATPLVVLAQIQSQLNQPLKAGQNAKNGVEMMRKVFPKNHPKIGDSIQIYLKILVENGGYAEAIPLCEELIENQEHFHLTAFELSETHTTLGVSLFRTGNLGKAEAAYRQALKCLDEVGANKSEKALATIHVFLADVLLRQSKSPEAEGFIEKAIKILEKHSVTGHLDPDTLLINSEILLQNNNAEGAEKAAREALESCEQLQDIAPETSGFAHLCIANALSKQDDFAGAAKEQRKALGLIKDELHRMKVLTKLSITLAELKEKDEADTVLKEIEEWAQNLKAPQSSQVLGKLDELFLNHFNGKNWRTAESLVRTSIRLKLAGNQEADIDMDKLILGNVLLERGRYHESEEILSELLLSFQTRPNAPPKLVAAIHIRLGSSLFGQGKDALAKTEVQKTLEIMGQFLEPIDPQILYVRMNLARIIHKQKNDKAAIEIFREILAAVGPKDQSLEADTRESLAESLASLGQLEAAEKEVLKSQQLNRALGEDIDERSLGILATILRDQGKFSDADPLFNEALESVDERLEEGHPDRAPVRIRFAKSLVLQKNFKDALSLTEVALEIQQKGLRADHPDLEESFDLLSEIHVGLGNPGKAAGFKKSANELRSKLKNGTE